MTDFGRIALVANPAARNGQVASAISFALEGLHEAFGIESVTLFETKCAGHGIDIARDLGDHFGTIVALGGDGLVHEIVNGLMTKEGRRQRLAVIPMGSGNDFAKSLGMSGNVTKAVEQILAGTEIQCDIGQCNDEYFAETLSFGLDAAIALGTMGLRRRTNLRGLPLYMLSSFNELARNFGQYPFAMELEEGERVRYVDGVVESVEPVKHVEGEAYLLTVQNGQTYGGGFRIAPGASLEDGRFDIVFAKPPLGRAQATTLLLRAKDGKHVGSDALEFYRARGVVIRPAGLPPIQIDGERLLADEMRVRLHQGALSVIVANQ